MLPSSVAGPLQRVLSPPNVVAGTITAVAAACALALSALPLGGSWRAEAGTEGSRYSWNQPVFLGFGPPEGWGRWTIGDRAVLRFPRPLPASFRLTLRARALGPNVGRDVQIRIGSAHRTVRFGDEPSDVSLDVRTSIRCREIGIVVPQPVSPRSLGLGADDRPLGVGVVSLLIEAQVTP